jgi:hypothetical protein
VRAGGFLNRRGEKISGMNEQPWNANGTDAADSYGSDQIDFVSNRFRLIFENPR